MCASLSHLFLHLSRLLSLSLSVSLTPSFPQDHQKHLRRPLLTLPPAQTPSASSKLPGPPPAPHFLVITGTMCRGQGPSRAREPHKHLEVGHLSSCERPSGRSGREIGGSGLKGLAEAHGEPWGIRVEGLTSLFLSPPSPLII